MLSEHYDYIEEWLAKIEHAREAREKKTETRLNGGDRQY